MLLYYIIHIDIYMITIIIRYILGKINLLVFPSLIKQDD